VTSEKVKIVGARLAFANLDKADYFKKGQPKDDKEVPMFRATLLLDPTDKAHAEAIEKIKSEAKRISLAFWEGNIPKNNFHKCYGNGNDLDKVYDGFKDMFYIRLASKDRIPVVGRRKNSEGKFVPLQAGDPEWPYNGSYVNATVTLWTQDSHGRKGINGNLIAVQFNKPGKAFGRPEADPNNEFDALEDDTSSGGGSAAGEDNSMWD
jgi:hypothetical protein